MMVPILFDCFILILISAESRIALIGFQFLIDLRGQHHFWIPLLTVFSPKLTVQITPFIINMRKVPTVEVTTEIISFYSQGSPTTLSNATRMWDQIHRQLRESDRHGLLKIMK